MERVRIVKDAKGRGRGYAFVVYERERDMQGYSDLAVLFRYLDEGGIQPWYLQAILDMTYEANGVYSDPTYLSKPWMNATEEGEAGLGRSDA